MPIPQPISDALATVQADAEELANLKEAAETAATNLDTATHADATARAAVKAGADKLGSDLSALISLEQSTYAP
jgi:hypothetical protein